MAEHSISGKILLRNDTALNWNTENPVLGKGEMGIEIDSNKFKIGDGTKTWSQLGYAGTVVAASNTNGHITIDGTDTTVYTLPTGGSSIGGVKTTSSGAGTVKINSSGTMELNTSGVALLNNLPTYYSKVQVDKHGIVVAGGALTDSDIPILTLSKISDAGTAASKDVGTSSGNVPVLDSNGKLNTSVMPALALNTTKVVATEAARKALTTSDVQNGDVVIVTGTKTTYMVIDDTKLSQDAGYTQILTPDAPVQSVNGKTGTVSLTTTDVAEGNNLYYTQARFNTAFAAKASSGLTDGSTIVHSTDTLIIDCGGA